MTMAGSSSSGDVGWKHRSHHPSSCLRRRVVAQRDNNPGTAGSSFSNERMCRIVLAVSIVLVVFVNAWLQNQHAVGLVESTTLLPHQQQQQLQDYPTSHAARQPMQNQKPWNSQTNVTTTNRLPNHRHRRDDVEESSAAAAASDDNPNSLPVRVPTHRACSSSDVKGIYHIAMGDVLGGVGTALLQLVLGQLLYAERYHLKPWVHFVPNVSQVIEDPNVHLDPNRRVSFTAMVGRNATYRKRTHGHWKDAFPGPPDSTTPVHSQALEFAGSTGIWDHYFEPVSDFVPGDRSCESKLYVAMDLYLITPGLHGYSTGLATRCWRYEYLPEYITQPHIPSITEWLEPQRKRAHRVMKQYIHFRPYLIQAAHRANPNCHLDSSSSSSSCLGLHIRHSDKAAGRRQVTTSEFLPFAQAFVDAGGQHIYLATDSSIVLKEIEHDWPTDVQSRIRHPNNIVRSSDHQAVFDIAGAASHHRTNQEVLIEILALSFCQFMVHGLSAVSEASIWINLDLHDRSVNLEDTEHIEAPVFETMVRSALTGKPQETVPKTIKTPTEKWWEEASAFKEAFEYNKGAAKNSAGGGGACHGFDGVLRIASVGGKNEVSTGQAFFTHILNQLLYADKYNLKPWVHLDVPRTRNNDGNNDAEEESLVIFDRNIHDPDNRTLSFDMVDGTGVSIVETESQTAANQSNQPYSPFPGPLNQRSKESQSKLFTVSGNGIWNSYFEPVSDFVIDDPSCREKPLITMQHQLVEPGLSSYCPWSVRAWKYDRVPDHLWWSNFETEKTSRSTSSNITFQAWVEPMRIKGHQMVKKYYRFRPYLSRRAQQANPVDGNGKQQPCLAVHIRVGDKAGKYRVKVKADQYQPYMKAFVQAGGQHIYLATDSRRALQFIENNFPEHLTKIIRTQGKHVVRTSKEYPTFMMDNHHRVNSETLVDILAMSKCTFLLHTFSTVSEAAIYLNLGLHQNSVNLEDVSRLSPKEFEDMVRRFQSNPS